MLKVSGNKIYLTRGDSAVFELNVTDPQGDSYDFSNDEVKFTVKKSCDDAKAVIEKTFDENGQITFTPDDTKDLSFGNYFYDVQLTHTETVDEETVTTVDTIIVPSTFVIGAECTW